MIRSRVRVMRMIAVSLSFAMTTQVSATQVANCTMRGMNAGDNHAATMQHQHQAANVVGSAHKSGDSDSRNSGDNRCAQIMVCVNVVAVPTSAIRGCCLNDVSLPIPFLKGALQARALHPEPPPPRV